MLSRAPSQLEEAAKRVARKQPDDDGRVIEGRTLAGPEARQGRYWPFVTGFPFPLGPILTRQTVRHEVSHPSAVARQQAGEMESSDEGFKMHIDTMYPLSCENIHHWPPISPGAHPDALHCWP